MIGGTPDLSSMEMSSKPGRALARAWVMAQLNSGPEEWRVLQEQGSGCEEASQSPDMEFIGLCVGNAAKHNREQISVLNMQADQEKKVPTNIQRVQRIQHAQPT